MSYQLTTEPTVIRRLSDGAFIPQDPANRHYQEYLEWLDAGNTPEPAPEPPAPAPDYRAFWLALIGTDLYAAIREQSSVSLPLNTMATEFIALLTDAKNGFPIEAAIQQSLLLILQTGSFTEAHMAELQLAMEEGHLDGVYSLEPAAP